MDQWRLVAPDVAARLRHALDGGRIEDMLEVWQSLDDAVGGADDRGVRQELVALRASVIQIVAATCLSRLADTARRSSEAAWTDRLTMMAHAVSLYRAGLAVSLCAAGDFGSGQDAAQAMLEEGTRALRQGRWAEASDTLRLLSEVDALPDLVRARLLAMLGQIELYHLFRADEARLLVEAAARLASDDGRVVAALGDCEVRAGDKEKGTALYRRAIECSPRQAAGYVGLGEVFEDRQQFDLAEEWFRNAMSAAIGDTAGGIRLLRLFGRRELFAAHRHELLPLFDLIVAIDPEDEAAVCTALGRAFLDNDLPNEAQQWYDRALEVAPDASSTYVALAAAREKQERYPEAEAAYTQAIQLAPLAYDGRVGLAFLYEHQGQWDKALRAWQNVPRYVEEWADVANARVGAMYTKLGDFEAAERALRAVIRTDKSTASRQALEELATEYSTRRADYASAIRIYGQLLETLGDAYRASYLDRVGYLYLAEGDIPHAMEHFRDALAIEPDNSAFHRSLADAFERERNYALAAEQHEEAHRLDGDTERFHARMALLRNSEANVAYTDGAYLRAVELYEQAIQLAPRDAVMLSNLASAYERAASTDGAHYLGKALDAYARAYAITQAPEYERGMARLRLKQELSPHYGNNTLRWLNVVTPVALEVAGDLIPLMEGGPLGGLTPEMTRSISQLRAGLLADVGVAIPGVRVRGNDADYPDGTYVILLMEVPLASGTARADERFCRAGAQDLARHGMTGITGTDPKTGDDGVWIAEEHWDTAAAAGFDLWDARSHIVRHLECIIRRNLIDFIGVDEVVGLLEAALPGMGEQLRADTDKLTSLVTVCRALGAEGVPLTSFREVWSEFDRGYANGGLLESIVESIRAVPPVRERLHGDNQARTLVPLGPAVQDAVVDAIQVSGSHSLLVMEPERCQEALASVRAALPEPRRSALVVDDSTVRPHVHRLIELEFPDTPVLTRDEVSVGAATGEAAVVEVDGSVAPTLASGSWQRGRAFPGVWRDARAEAEVVPVGITVFVSDGFLEQHSAADESSLADMLTMMTEGLFYQLGLLLPDVRVVRDNRLPVDTFSFTINGRPVPPVRGLQSDEILVNDTPDRLTLLKIEARAAVNPATGAEAAIVRELGAEGRTCKLAGLTVWGPGGYLILTLSAHIRANAPSFVTTAITQLMLETQRGVFPELTEMASRRFNVDEIRELLQSLLEEEISIRDLRSILTSMALVNGTTTVDLSKRIVFPLYTGNLCHTHRGAGSWGLPIADYTEFVRCWLRRQVANKFTRGGNTLVVYLVHPDIERVLAAAGDRIPELDRTRLLAAVGAELGELPSTSAKPVVLTTLDVRKSLWKLLRSEFSNLSVLSYQELPPDINVQPVARISWAAGAVKWPAYHPSRTKAGVEGWMPSAPEPSQVPGEI